MPKHTPGPWEVKGGIDLRDFIVTEPTDNTICEPNTALFEDPAEFDPNVRRISIDEAMANARLIAAAPDLLEALEGVTGHMIGLKAYLATCNTQVIVENLESTIAALRAQVELAEAAIRKGKGEHA